MTEHRKHDEPLAGLLRHTLARHAGPRSDCPAPEILAAYFDRSLAGDESAGWELHFSACDRCQQQLAALARVASALPPATDASPSVASAAQVPSRGIASFWKLRWLAPAAAALAAVTVWVVLRAPQQPPQPGAVTTIAENRQASPAAPQPARPDSTPAETPVKDIPANQEKDAAGKVGRIQSGGKAGEDAKRAFSQHSAPTAPPAGITADQLKQPAEPGARRRDADQPADLRDANEFAIHSAKEKAKEEAAGSTDRVAALSAAKPAPAPPPDAKARQAASSEVRRTDAFRYETRDEAKKTDAAAAPRAMQEMVVVEAPAAGALRKNQPDSGYASAFVADSQVVWRLGPAGSVERSTDAGANWQRQSSGVTADLIAGAAPSATVCWAVGRSGLILRTTDAGATWQQLGSPSSLDLVAIEARDTAIATVTTAGGKRYATSDAGRTWKSQ